MTDALRPRVLLIDDHPEILAAAARLLQPACIVVGEFTSGRLAIDGAKRIQPDVVVLDLNLPDASGFELCAELLEAVPGVRVVITTALTDRKIEDEAFRRGASAFVVKWQMADHLLSTVYRIWRDDLTVDLA
jgi:DNA-binding NarL/FixJ family response regulator